MRFKNELIALVLIGFLSTSCAPKRIVWETILSKETINGVVDVVPLVSGGYVMGGHTQEYFEAHTANYNSNLWIVKLDNNGKVLWNKVLGDNDRNVTRSIVETRDRGFLIGAWQKQKDSTYIERSGVYIKKDDLKAIKLNSEGVLEWEKSINGNYNDYTQSVQETLDNGFFITGSSSSTIGLDKTSNSLGGTDFWIVKLDSLRNIQWQRNYGGGRTEMLKSTIVSSRGGYLLAGYSDSIDNNDAHPNVDNAYDYFVIGLSRIGSPLWYKMIGGSGVDKLEVALQTRDGGFVLGGVSDSPKGEHKTVDAIGGFDVWLVKLDATGSLLWQQSYGGLGKDDIKSIQELNNGDLLLGCTFGSNDSLKTSIDHKNEFAVLRVNDVGILKWHVAIGGCGTDYLYTARQLENNHILLAGRSTSYLSKERSRIKGSIDIRLLKYNPYQLDKLQQQLEIETLETHVIIKSPKSYPIEIIEYYNELGILIKTDRIKKSRNLILNKNELLGSFDYIRLRSLDTSAIFKHSDFFP